jgi:hypothetical protein
MPENLPDDPVLLKQMLLEAIQDCVKPTRYRYTEANTGALGDPLQRTL